jgi:predicted ATPase/DNA-binding winged helix-turn-helix (wHTH) protein
MDRGHRGLLVVRRGHQIRQGDRLVCSLGRSRILFRLLAAIVEYGEELDRESLFSLVWELPYRPPSSDNSLYVAITRLRERLSASSIEIETGPTGGWRLTQPARVVDEVLNCEPPPRAPAPPMDGFFGRTAELDEIGAAFEGSTLVTLVGPGGMGKTRLARRFLRPSAERDAVWVELGSCRTESGVLAALEAGVGTRSGAADRLEALGATISASAAAFVALDEVEASIDSVRRLLPRLRAAAPRMRWLVTSREVLGLPGERAIELGPLDAPSAVALFEDRAGASRDRSNTEELVRRLDGLPLAIELAAARSDTLTVPQLLDRLDRRLDLLTRSGGSPRARSMRASLDASWDVLEAWEREALLQCRVFRGGFDADAAEAVIDLSDFPAAPWTLDVLDRLRKRSLVHRRADAATPRMGLYETLRSLLDEKAGTRDRDRAVRRRAAEWFVGRAEGAASRIRSADGAAAAAWLERERGNLDAALAVGLEEEPALAARVALALDPVLALRGRLDDRLTILGSAIEVADNAPAELRVRLREARARAILERASIEQAASDLRAARADLEAESPPELRARLEQTEGNLAVRLGDLEAAEIAFRGALKGYTEAGDERGQGMLMGNLGTVLHMQGRSLEAEHQHRMALEIHRRVGNRPSEAVTGGSLANALAGQGRSAEAESAYRDSIKLSEELGNHWRVATNLVNLALVQLEAGRSDEADEGCAKAHRTFASLGALGGMAHAAVVRGAVRLHQGRPESAEPLLLEALSAFEADQNSRGRFEALVLLAEVAGRRGHREVARNHLDRACSVAEPTAADSARLAVARRVAGLDAGPAIDLPDPSPIGLRIAARLLEM